MQIDLFYKTYPGDYQFLEHSLKSAKRYAQGFRDIVIVTDHGHLDALRDIVEPLKIPSLKIFELDSELDAYPPNKLPRRLRKLMRSFLKIVGSSRRIIKQEKFGYEIQKAVKCDWIQWSDADAVLQIDSDTMLNATLDTKQLFKEQHPIWLRQTWEKSYKRQINYWRPGSLWLYGLNESKYCYMSSPCFFLTRELTEQFQDFVATKHRCSLYRLFTNPRFPQLSEYELLGLFAEINQLDTPYHFEDEANAETEGFSLPTKLFWSWGGMTDEVKSELAKLEQA